MRSVCKYGETYYSRKKKSKIARNGVPKENKPSRSKYQKD